MEKELFKQFARMTVMNSKLLIQIYGLHHDFVEKVLPLIPGDTTLLAHIARTEQLSAALIEAQASIEKSETGVQRVNSRSRSRNFVPTWALTLSSC
jgi:hypothetical protein